MIPVTPRDRKAAAHYFILAGEDEAASAVLRGERDDYALVQTMAGHRDGWQDIATAPKGVQIVGLCAHRGSLHYGVIVGIKHDLIEQRPDWVLDEWTGRSSKCTHWMPLPEAPETGK